MMPEEDATPQAITVPESQGAVMGIFLSVGDQRLMVEAFLEVDGGCSECLLQLVLDLTARIPQVDWRRMVLKYGRCDVGDLHGTKTFKDLVAQRREQLGTQEDARG